MTTQTMTSDAALEYPNLDTHTASISNKKLWAGRVISAVPALLLLSSGINMSRKASFVMEGFVHLGYPESLALAIGVLEFVCAALYVIPRTAILGAVLLTGYLGGATASHVRVGDPFFAPVIVGVLVWVGLFLRDEHLRAFVTKSHS